MIADSQMFLLALALSFLVGGSLGLLGGGGSILTMPIVLYVLGMETHAAITTSLIVVGATSLVALLPHARGGRVRWRTGLLFGVTSMASAFAAGKLAGLVPGAILLVAFGALMLVTGFAMMRRRREIGRASGGGRGWGRLILQGLGVGAITGFVGAGGGFVVVPALALLGGLAMKEAVGTSLLVIAMNSAAAVVGHLGAVEVPVLTASALTAVAIGGSVVGGSLAGRIRHDVLRRAFAWFVIVMAVFLLSQEVPRSAGFEVTFAAHWGWILGGAAIPLLVGAVDLARFTAGLAPAESERNA
ncbi:MAG TPA: sulfite exporter TauE/SafE family protein [Vulgatibacter sp.]|nr:sulfite exporter TauE/SafE family protein [Vulgatibacter sp.]